MELFASGRVVYEAVRNWGAFMEYLSFAELRGDLFLDRADDLLKRASEAKTIGSQLALLCMAQSYREMAAKALSQLN